MVVLCSVEDMGRLSVVAGLILEMVVGDNELESLSVLEQKEEKKKEEEEEEESEGDMKRCDSDGNKCFISFVGDGDGDMS